MFAKLKGLKASGLTLVGTIGLFAACSVAAAGLVGRSRSAQELAQWTKAQSVPTVALTRIQEGDPSRTLTLPGTIQPFYKASIYARVNGYLKSWTKDIGAPVKSGDVLATIEAPDLDQQLAQAKATLASAKASYEIATITASRNDILVKKQVVSQQIADQTSADATAKKAVVDANEANVRQLQAMQGFKQIVAPFDGIVTARSTDIGALINAGSAAGQQLFEVSDLHRVRIYVQVPQAFSADLRPGLHATFQMPQYPGREFDATLISTSHAMEPSSRSMLVELQADNPDGTLLGGTYCQVEFQIPADRKMVRLPATALVPDSTGAQVAVLNAGNTVAFKTIQLGRDFGDSVEVTAGLSADDRVIANPPETLRSGDRVQVAAAAPLISAKAATTPPMTER